MKNRQLGEIDRIFYMLGKVALAVVLAAVLLYFCTGISVLRIYNPCLFYQLTGYYCPGCGGTRSLRAILEGDLIFALYAYPPIPYAIVTYTIFMVRCFVRKHFASKQSLPGEENGKTDHRRDEIVLPYIYVGVALVILQWIAKLLAKAIWQFDWFKSL